MEFVFSYHFVSSNFSPKRPFSEKMTINFTHGKIFCENRNRDTLLLIVGTFNFHYDWSEFLAKLNSCVKF